MNVSNNADKKKSSLFGGSIFGYTWKSRGIVFFLNILCVLVFGAIGFYFANFFGKNTKLFTIIGVALSFPVSQFIIYKKLTSKN